MKRIHLGFFCALPVVFALACGSSAVPGVDPTGETAGGERGPARVTLTEGAGFRVADGALVADSEGDLTFAVGRFLMLQSQGGLRLCAVGRFRALAEVPADAPCLGNREVGTPADWNAWASLGVAVSHDDASSRARGLGFLVGDKRCGASHRLWISSTSYHAGGGRVVLELEPVR